MASGIRNPNTTYDYVHETWEDGSKWTFRKEQTGDDRDLVANMTSKTIVGRMNRKKIRTLMREGGDLEGYVDSLTDTQTVMSAEKAMLGVMAVSVAGPFFTVPEDYLDEHGKKHPLAGKLIPQPPKYHLRLAEPDQYRAQMEKHLEWLALLDADVRGETFTFMGKVWAGADPEELKRAERGDRSVGEPARVSRAA